MMTQANTHTRQAFNPALPMEDVFEQFDVAQDLCMAGHNPYSDVQLKWLHRPAADKTWENFCTHFTEAHQYLQELQANAPNIGYTANTVSENIQSQMAEAIAQVVAATEDDGSTVSNLSETISQLVNQVANMACQMDQKDEGITELQKSDGNNTNNSDNNAGCRRGCNQNQGDASNSFSMSITAGHVE
eukprot:12387906-Ditylum_brightwellii.AAC.2